MKHETNDSAELQALREGLLACSPRREKRPRDPEQQIRAIEHHSHLATTRRRWFAGGAVVSIGACALLLLGATWYRRPAPPARPTHRAAVPERSTEQYSTAGTASVVDLGPQVGRILLRPHTRATYAAGTRTLNLFSGRIVAHIFPLGRGFRVRFGDQAVIVRGTLFSVDSTSGQVRVWHGVVDRQSASQPDKSETLQGTEAYGELSRRDLAWLAFTPPEAPPAKPALAPASRPALPGPRRPDPAAHQGRLGEDRPPYHPDPMRQDLLLAQHELATGRAEAALARLERYEVRFPSSPLLEEAFLFKLRALVALRRFRRLQQMSHMFLRRYPASAKRGEVELLQQRAAAHLKKAGSR